MKKLILSLSIAVISTVQVLAQGTTVATLIHGNDITQFYGYDAFTEAYSAADNGDEILLSSGKFNSCSISKPLTIRGCGYQKDSLTNRIPTELIGGFSIFCHDTTTDTNNDLLLEGVLCENISYGGMNYNCIISKCEIEKLSCHPNANNYSCNVDLINCRFNTALDFNNNTNPNVKVYNCICRFAEIRYGTIINCTFLRDAYTYHHLTNNIIDSSIILSETMPAFEQSNVVTNCLAVTTRENVDFFPNHPGANNKVVSKDIFKDYPFEDCASYSSTYDYQLTDEAKAELRNDRDEEIGVWGGIGFSVKPNAPAITKFKVEPRTTDEGILKVEIEATNPAE